MYLSLCFMGRQYELFNSVFMSPETAVTPPWRNVFASPQFQQRLSLIAVDEAHCIFEWLD